jgi:hypothetical protein
MVGLLPLCAVTVFEGGVFAQYPESQERMRRFLTARPEIKARFTKSRSQALAAD